MGSRFWVRIDKLWKYGGSVCIPWDGKCRIYTSYLLSDKKPHVEANCYSNLSPKSNANTVTDIEANTATDITANIYTYFHTDIEANSEA